MEKKHLNLFLKIFGIVAMLYAISMVILPQLLMELHWKNAPGQGGIIILQGWGLTLFGLGFISFNASELKFAIQQMISRGIFLYFAPLFFIWLFDMITHGLVIVGVLTFGVIITFATCGGYFGFLFKPSSQ